MAELARLAFEYKPALAIARKQRDTGLWATNVPHPRSNPNAAEVAGFAVNSAVAMPACRAASASVVTLLGSRALGSARPSARAS